MLNFSFAEGTAVLKLSYQYDLTTVSLCSGNREIGR